MIGQIFSILVIFYLFLERCLLGPQMPGTYTLTCAFSRPQFNVTKATLSLADFNKVNNRVARF